MKVYGFEPSTAFGEILYVYLNRRLLAYVGDRMEPTYFLVDLDGVLLDSIEPAFVRHGIRGGTRLSNAYREFFLYAPMNNLLRKRASRHLGTTPKIKDDTIDFILQMEAKGLVPVFQTRNPTRRLDYVKNVLAERGVMHYHSVRYLSPGDPGILVDGSKPAFILQDDPIDALRAAAQGVTVIFLKTSYNGAASRAFSAINDNIKIVRGFTDRAIDAANVALKKIYVVPSFSDATIIANAIAQHNMQTRSTH